MPFCFILRGCNNVTRVVLPVSFLKFKNSQNEQDDAEDHTDNAGYYFDDRAKRCHAGTDHDSAHCHANNS